DGNRPDLGAALPHGEVPERVPASAVVQAVGDIATGRDVLPDRDRAVRLLPGVPGAGARAECQGPCGRADGTRARSSFSRCEQCRVAGLTLWPGPSYGNLCPEPGKNRAAPAT